MRLPSNLSPDRALDRGVYVYRVDVGPRDAPAVTLAGGIGSGDAREVVLGITHKDAFAGRRDVADMLVWGDIDPNSHPRIATSSGASAWMPFAPETPIVLSAGVGVKTINVRLRFLSGRTVDGSATYTLTAPGAPYVTMLRYPWRKYLTSADSVTLAWSCTHAVTAVQVAVAPSSDSDRSACTVLGAGTNVNGAVSAAAGAMVESSFTYATVLAATQANTSIPDLTDAGQAWIKVFAQTALGWTT